MQIPSPYVDPFTINIVRDGMVAMWLGRYEYQFSVCIPVSLWKVRKFQEWNLKKLPLKLTWLLKKLSLFRGDVNIRE